VIGRRDFIGVLGGAVAAWPLAARAQQLAMPVIRYLSALSEAQDDLTPFRRGLSEIGFTEGRNVSIERRSANNDFSRLSVLAVDLLRRRLDVIYASGGSVAALAAKASTKSVPIVFAMGDDPVASGLVPSLSRPGGNVTGITFLSTELGPKRLTLLKELVPAATHYALLVNPNAPNASSIVAVLSAAADSIGRRIEVFRAAILARSILRLRSWFEGEPMLSSSAAARCWSLERCNLPPWRRITGCRRFTTIGEWSMSVD
jgi:putative ABC transport system substrate-binding protein